MPYIYYHKRQQSTTLYVVILSEVFPPAGKADARRTRNCLLRWRSHHSALRRSLTSFLNLTIAVNRKGSPRPVLTA